MFFGDPSGAPDCVSTDPSGPCTQVTDGNSKPAVQVTTLPHLNGIYDVHLSTSAGASPTTGADSFVFVAGQPVVSSISPDHGPIAGGTVVTITGTALLGATQVEFWQGGAGGHTVFSVNCPADCSESTDTGLKITVPGLPGASPNITSVVPNIGPSNGGTVVTVSGNGFFAPDATGRAFELRVFTEGGLSDLNPANDTFTYDSDGSGSRVTKVNFGGTAGTALSVSSDNHLTVTSPAHSMGLVDLQVITPTGNSATVVADRFTFTYPHGLTVPVAPSRILDTRTGSGYPGAGQKLGPNSSLQVQVSGAGGVPSDATTVAAVAMNVAVTDTTSGGNLVVYPSGANQPTVSNINWAAGQTISNLSEVPLGSGGMVTLFNNGSGSVDVILDVNAYVSTTTTGAAGRFNALPPARIVDTRTGPYAGQTIPAGGTLDVQVTGALTSDSQASGVPATGVEAVVMNLAETNATVGGHLTVYPFGSSAPNAANLNFGAGDTRSNRVLALLGPGGKITIRNNSGSVDVIVDVTGWIADSTTGVTTGASSIRCRRRESLIPGPARTLARSSA